MAQLFEWTMAHWDSIVEALAALHALAVAIVNITHTPSRYDPMHKPYQTVELMAGIVTRRAKE